MNWDKAGGWLLPLLDPVIVVVCLFAAQWACGLPVTPAIAYLALLAFIISIPLFALNLPQAGPPRRRHIVGRINGATAAAPDRCFDN